MQTEDNHLELKKKRKKKKYKIGNLAHFKETLQEQKYRMELSPSVPVARQIHDLPYILFLIQFKYFHANMQSLALFFTVFSTPVTVLK